MCRHPRNRFIFDGVLVLVLCIGIGLLTSTDSTNDFRCPVLLLVQSEFCYWCNEANMSNTSYITDVCSLTVPGIGVVGPDDVAVSNGSLVLPTEPCCCGASINKITSIRCPLWSAEISGNEYAAFACTFIGAGGILLMAFFEVWFYIGCIPDADGRPDVKRRAKELREKIAENTIDR